MEEDYCRICRGTSEEEPLSQPCRCDGSVRFIHQSCLQQWLAVSHKKSCELCKFEFKFTPVYADNAPATIPVLVVLRRLSMNLGSNFLKFTRFTTVGFLWLVLIPWLLFVFTFTLFSTVNKIPHPVERLAMASLFPNPIRAAEILEGQIIYVGMISIALILFFAKELLGLDQIEDPNRLLRERARQQILRDQLRAQLLRQEQQVQLEQAAQDIPVLENEALNPLINQEPPQPLRRFGIGEEQVDDNNLFRFTMHNHNNLSLEERRELARLRIERLEQRLRVDEPIDPIVQPQIEPVDDNDSTISDSTDDTVLDTNSEAEDEINDPPVVEPVRVEIPQQRDDPDTITELLGFTGSFNHAIYTAMVVLACLFALILFVGFLPFVLGYFSIRSLSTSIITTLSSTTFDIPNLLSNLLSPSTWSPRLICIAIGYSWLSILSVFALAIVASSKQSNSFLSRLVTLLDSKLKSFFKISLFLVIELVGFPFYSGVLLHMVSIYVLNMQYDHSFSLQYPVISLFLHWFIGTLFMFNFSIIVDKIRIILRPGVLWFLRDPNDADFKPIHDIMTQSFKKQFYKLSISAFMYFIFIVVGYGSYLTILTSKYSPLCLGPFRTAFSTLTEFPLDLLVFHFVLPIIYKVFDPKLRLQYVVQYILAYLGSVFDMNNYLFGGILNENKQSLSSRLISIPVLPNKSQFSLVDDIPSIASNTTNLALVPNKDSLKLKNNPSFIPVLFDKVQDTITELQLEPLHWTLITIPSHFKIKTWALFASFWILFNLFLISISFSAIQIGRSLLDVVFTNSHDIYAVLLGITIICVGVVAISKIKLFKTWGIRTIFKSFSVALLLVICLLVALPLSFMSLISAYFMMPTQLHNEKTMIRYYIHEWAIGVIYCRVLYVFIMMGPNNPIRNRIQPFIDGGIGQFDVKLFLGLFGRGMGIMGILYGLPWVIGVFMTYILGTFVINLEEMVIKQQIIKHQELPEKWILYGIDGINRIHGHMVKQSMYWVMMGYCLMVIFGIESIKKIRKMVQGIREDEFVVGRVLEDIDETVRGVREQRVG